MEERLILSQEKLSFLEDKGNVILSSIQQKNKIYLSLTVSIFCCVLLVYLFFYPPVIDPTSNLGKFLTLEKIKAFVFFFWLIAIYFCYLFTNALLFPERLTLTSKVLYISKRHKIRYQIPLDNIAKVKDIRFYRNTFLGIVLNNVADTRTVLHRPKMALANFENLGVHLTIPNSFNFDLDKLKSSIETNIGELHETSNDQDKTV